MPAASFELERRSVAKPLGADGEPQRRVVRGRVVLPEAGDPPFPVAILAHGYTSFMDWGFWPVSSEELARAGVATVRFNFSGSGIGPDLATMTEPETFRRNSYLHELEDLQVVHDHLRGGLWPALDPARCSLVGHSRGGAMGVIHAGETGDYRAVVTWAAIDRILNFSADRLAKWRTEGVLDVMHWTARRRLPVDLAVLEAVEEGAAAVRLDVRAAAGRLACPTLVVMGDADRSLDPAVGRRLARACGARGRLLEVVGGDHTFGAIHPLGESIPEPLRQVLDATVSHICVNSAV